MRDARLLAQQRLQFDMGIRRQTGQRVAVRLGQTLFCLQAQRQQLLGGDLPGAQPQSQYPSILAKSVGETGQQCVQIHPIPK
ncbi:hypothetical protein [Chromobacterium sp. ASV23]|uniref:hypothetical protein n=1 Tax=Chromobacterium sp. ASV23 TaxID=2795110 RepID=UPI001E5DC2CD|nr:hypothetical protein [Chromobacterium sp. ASV23]